MGSYAVNKSNASTQCNFEETKIVGRYPTLRSRHAPLRRVEVLHTRKQAEQPVAVS